MIRGAASSMRDEQSIAWPCTVRCVARSAKAAASAARRMSTCPSICSAVGERNLLFAVCRALRLAYSCTRQATYTIHRIATRLCYRVARTRYVAIRLELTTVYRTVVVPLELEAVLHIHASHALAIAAPTDRRGSPASALPAVRGCTRARGSGGRSARSSPARARRSQLTDWNQASFTVILVLRAHRIQGTLRENQAVLILIYIV